MTVDVYDDHKINYYSPQLSNYIVNLLVVKNKVKYHEIDMYYDLWELIKLYEITVVEIVNEKLTWKELNKK